MAGDDDPGSCVQTGIERAGNFHSPRLYAMRLKLQGHQRLSHRMLVFLALLAGFIGRLNPIPFEPPQLSGQAHPFDFATATESFETDAMTCSWRRGELPRPFGPIWRQR